jgi:thiol-disulfide isomerase/thioredoxin
MKSIRIPFVAATFFFAMPWTLFAAGEPKVPEAAQAEMKAGRELIGKNDWAGAVEHYRKAAGIAPRNLEVQEAFILYHRAGNLRTLKPEESEKRYHALRKHYEQEAAKEPRNPLWQILVGDVTFYEDPPASRRAFERAVQLDPNEAHALQFLGILAETRGENDVARRYFVQAAQARPDDPEYAGGIVGNLMDAGDFNAFRAKAMKVVEKWPTSSEAAKWMYWIGSKAPTPREQRQYWQEAIDKYPLDKVSEEQSGWLSGIYSRMFESLQKDDPIAAEDFARNTLRRMGKDDRKRWFTNYQRQSELNVARAAREAGQPAAALEVLARLEKSSTGPRDSMKTTIAYEKALDQAANGQSADAIQTLLALLKSEPNAVAEAAFYDIASKAGKTAKEADEMLWDVRLKDAQPFKNFELKDAVGKTASLSDYRGQVVLVNFWYPSCGPCRGEFPHLQKIVEQFRGKPFAVLALNTHPQEADKVRSFMEGNRYPFRALQTPTEDWAEKNYAVIGTPANFLLDQQGHVIAKPMVYDDETAGRLVTQIRQLLDRVDQAKPSQKPGS